MEMDEKTLLRLHDEISQVCPIISVRASGVIDFHKAATPEQRQAAKEAFEIFDPSPAAHAQWIDRRNPEKKDIKDAAQDAIDGNAAFMALSPPTQAQVVGQVKVLSRQNNKIMSMLLKLAIEVRGNG